MNIPERLLRKCMKQRTLKYVKNGKNKINNRIANELLIYCGNTMADQLIQLINNVPKAWKISIEILMFKKGD